MTFLNPTRTAQLPSVAWSSAAQALARARSHAAVLLVACAVAVGVGLRLAAARGDLWLDELWSLDLVSHVSSPDQVFWAIAHDNNHFLNSFWMALIGQDRSPLAYRLPSLVFSTLAIFVAARIGWRVNRAAGVAAAFLTACSYAFVDYGSEARGYAALMLFVIVAVDLNQTVVNALCAGEEPGREMRRNQWLLGLAIALGTCAHLTMVVTAGILGLSTVLRLKAAGRSLPKALDQSMDLFRPALILIAPVIACIALASYRQGGFSIGGSVPFTVGKFFEGFGGLLNVLMGTSWFAPSWLAVVLAAVLVGGALAAGLLDRRWTLLALTALAIVPGLIFAARVKNTEYARYFLVAGLVLPIFLAEIAGRLWTRGGGLRWVAVGLVGAVCLGQVPSLAGLLVNLRGAPAAAVARMAAEGPALYRARNPMITDPVIANYAVRQGASLTVTPSDDLCRHPAEWVVYDSDFGEAVPAVPELGKGECRSTYALVQSFPAALWSGRSWTLFRRIRQPGS